MNNHAEFDRGLRGAVTAVRKCKGDEVSVTLRFARQDALDALKIPFGSVIEIVQR